MDIVAQMDAMTEKGYFEQVDALATSLTMASYFSTSEAPKPDYRTTTPARASKELSLISASALSTFADLIPTQRIKAAVTNLKSAVKPGYSALIPAVAILFYARFKLDNEGLL